MRAVLAASAFFLVSLLTGCSSNFSMPTVDTGSSVIRGTVYGGQQPISGSHLYVYAMGTSGVGSASTSLLESVPGTTTADANGNYYVTTGSDGSFTINGDYTCVAGQQVYLLADGGNAGSGANTYIRLLAGLGQCPASGTLSGTVSKVSMNEVTTVGTAYALAGMAADSTHIGNSSSIAGTNAAANGMAMVSNIIDIATGSALTITPNHAGIVPQTMINTIANILAGCVNSTGDPAGDCGTLMANTRSQMQSGNPTPANTADAALYLANNAETASVNATTLYNTIISSAPFEPYLTTAPTAYTVRLDYYAYGEISGGGNPADLSTPLNMGTLAIDQFGYPWVVGKYLRRISPLGALTTYQNTIFANPSSIAIEPASSLLFVADAPAAFGNTGTNTLYSFNDSGTNIGTQAIPPSTTECTTTSCQSLVADGNGYIWTNDTKDQVSRIDGFGGVTVFPFDIQAVSFSFDSSGYMLVSDHNTLERRIFSGTTSTAHDTFSTTNFWMTALPVYHPQNVELTEPEYGVAADAESGDLLLIDYDAFGAYGVHDEPYAAYSPGISSLAVNSTTEVFGTSGSSSQLQMSTLNSAGDVSSSWPSMNSNPMGAVAIDAGGNVWAIENNGASIAEYLGLATPVSVPLNPLNANGLP